MSNSFNLPPVDNIPKPSPQIDADSPKKSDVQSGYDQKNTSSSLVATSKQPAVNITDIKTNNYITSSNYLNDVMKDKIANFKNTLVNYNNQFFDLYKNNSLGFLNDSASIMLTISNFFHNFKMLSTLNSIADEAGAKQGVLQQQENLVKNAKNIKDADKKIVVLETQRQGQLQSLEQLLNSMNNKVNELNTNTADIKKLQNQSNNDSAIDELQQKVTSLQQQINELLAEATVVETLLTKSNQQLGDVANDKQQFLQVQHGIEIFTKKLEGFVGKVPALLTSVLTNPQIHLQILATQLKKADNTKNEKKADEIEISNSQLKTQQELHDLLDKEFLQTIQNIFLPPAIAGSQHNNPIPENLVAPVSLVLMADINEKKFPSLSHKQPHLGESLSLDGADNPLAYGMILLQYNMQKLQESMATDDDLLSKGQQQQFYLQQLFDLSHNVDLLFFNALQASSEITQGKNTIGFL